MKRDTALEILSRHRPELAQRFGVTLLALFGSVARDEAGLGSDVDVLVEFAPEAHVGLFGFVRLRRHLESLLGAKVDLATFDALKPQLRERIVKELVHAT